MRFRLRTLLILLAIGPPLLGQGCHKAENPLTSANVEPRTTMPTTDPAETVKAFIAAYHAWQDAAFARSQAADADGLARARKITIEEHDKQLVARFYAPTVVPQSPTYGTYSMHDLARETIESVSVDGAKAIVITKHNEVSGLASQYEYHLSVIDGAWKLTSLLYVDTEGKYECL